MNKAQLIEMVATNAELPKTAATKALDAILDSIVEALAEGDSVALVGFGSFSVRSRAAKIGRNPKTGEPLNIPAAKIPAFKPGKTFKEAVNEEKTAAAELEAEL